MVNEEDTSLPAPRVSKRQRQKIIVQRFGAVSSLRASDLAADLGVSGETIRRDLVELDTAGLLARTFGGAVRPLASEDPIKDREGAFVEQRTRMALRVAHLVKPHEVVMIASGGTTYHVALALAAHSRDITVVTHGVNIAMALASNPTIRVLLLPGRYNGREGYVYGSQTLAAIEKYKANWSVVGATGVDEQGIYDANDEAAAVHRAIALQAAKSLLVVDSSKFNQAALSNYADWSEMHALVTDVEPEDPLRRTIRESGCRILV